MIERLALRKLFKVFFIFIFMKKGILIVLFLSFLLIGFVGAEEWCKDSDGGVNPFVKGICEDSRGVIIEDGCELGFVAEAYCMTGEMREYCKKFNSADYCDNLPSDCFKGVLGPDKMFTYSYFDFQTNFLCLNGCLDGECSYSYFKEENCTGCFKAGKCYYYSYRLENMFCGESGLIEQYPKNDPCELDFECESNFCKEGICSSRGFF